MKLTYAVFGRFFHLLFTSEKSRNFIFVAQKRTIWLRAKSFYRKLVSSQLGCERKFVFTDRLGREGFRAENRCIAKFTKKIRGAH